MKNLRHLRIVALVAALAVPAASLSGCGSISADVIAVQTGVSIAQMVLTAIQNFSNTYFTSHPDADKQAKIQQAIAVAEAAAGTAAAAAQAATDLKADNVTQAFGDFEAAYEDVLALVKDLGVVTVPAGSNLTAERLAGRLYVVTPDALLPKGVDVAKVHARSISVKASRARANDQACRGIMTTGADGRPHACTPDLAACVPLASCQPLSLRSPGAGKPAEPPTPIYTRLPDGRLCEFYNTISGECFNPDEVAAEQEGRVVNLADVR